ncbi:TPM domain-containing protein [Corynebacterium sp.]|uniref:TPM domain-containing protein n=1 Tax=Corynebacterium sp. TaxID=1720 RepID=UPI0026DC0E56|nr:TPM domain-containing protein [Corynebacterium sp.]MDO5076033.1 TPM domain-containing protein [Corynebacterium sp.]
MISKRPNNRLLSATFAALCVAAAAALSNAPLVFAAAPAPPAPALSEPVVPGSTDPLAPSKLTSHVVDHSGVLTEPEIAELEAMISQVRKEKRRDMFVVLQPSFGSLSAEEFSERTFKLNRADNVLVLVIATEDRKYAVSRETNDSKWSASEAQKVEDAAYNKLTDLDFKGAVYAAVTTARGKPPATPEEIARRTRNGYAILGGGAASLVAAGGGAWALRRRKRKRTIESAREISPSDVKTLGNLPDDVLEQLAQEELVSTDESIRGARSELDLAMSEFGAERVRPFTSAMNKSTSTLQRAFQLKQEVDTKNYRDLTDRRSKLVEIVSSCGQADDALEAVATEFAELRNLLVNAPTKIEEITQQLVDLRTRLPKAQATLEELQRNYEPSVIDSIDENVDLASELTTKAEESIDSARKQLELPVGSQGGVVDAIRNAENAIAHADKALGGIENAVVDIAQAQSGIPPLIAEIEAEVQEAHQLKEQGQAHGTPANWQAVTETLNRAPEVISTAQASAEADPLATYATLVEYDAELDLLLDTVRESNAQQARALQILDNTLATAGTALRTGDDYIGTRGKIVGSAARTMLAEAHRYHAQAIQNRTSNTRGAISLAKMSATQARRALKAARNDVSEYHASQQRNNSFSSGMIAGHIISSGGGGFSGGFSGGGFSGGGGGISTSSGSF